MRSECPGSAAGHDEEQLRHAGFRCAQAVPMQNDVEELVHDARLRLYGHGEPARCRGAFFVAIRNLFVDRYRRYCRLAAAMATVCCCPARSDVSSGGERAPGLSGRRHAGFS